MYNKIPNFLHAKIYLNQPLPLSKRPDPEGLVFQERALLRDFLGDLGS